MNKSKFDYSYDIEKHQAVQTVSKDLQFLPAIVFENWMGIQKVMGVFKKDFMKNSRYSVRSLKTRRKNKLHLYGAMFLIPPFLHFWLTIVFLDF
jgi:hypothetical protein